MSLDFLIVILIAFLFFHSLLYNSERKAKEMSLSNKKIQDLYIDINNKSNIRLVGTEYLMENTRNRKISLGVLKYALREMSQKTYPKELDNVPAEKFYLTDGYDAFLVARTSRNEVRVYNALKHKYIDPCSKIEIIKVPQSNLLIVPSEHFVSRSKDRAVNLDIISAIDKQLSTSKIGQPYVVSDGLSTIVAVKINYTSILLQTCYLNGQIDWDDFLDKKISNND